MVLNDLPNHIQIDINGSLERFSNFEPMYIKYLKKFITEKTYDTFKQDIMSGNLSAVESSAHTIKGICGNLGLTELYEIYSNIVKSVRERDMSNLKNQYLLAIKKTEETIAILKQLD